MNDVMKRLLAALALVVPVTSARADRIALPAPTVLDCTAQPSPAIATDAGEYRVTGTCDKLTISGSQNVVTVDATKNLAITGGKNEVTIDKVDKIAITGTANRVAYKAGLSAAAPKTASAHGNIVRKLGAETPSSDDLLLKEKPLPGATVGPVTTIDCAQTPTQTITSSRGRYTFTGSCKLITVRGNINILRVERATRIVITGSTNTVLVDAIGSLSVAGTDNSVRWTRSSGRDKPAISTSGKRNTIERNPSE